LFQSDDKRVLITTPFFSPNVGGAETHLLSLLASLNECGIRADVVTYQPLTTRLKGKIFERLGDNRIFRVPWFGYNWFPSLERMPAIEFLYLFPGLFLGTFVWLLFNRRKITVIHAQGFIAGAVSGLLAKIFALPSIISTYAVYNLNRRPLLARVFKVILNLFDRILSFAELATEELLSIGIARERIGRYTYWVDQMVFRPLDREACRKKFGFIRPTLLFCGRLIEIKGAHVALETAKILQERGVICDFAFLVTGDRTDFNMLPGADGANVRYIDIPYEKNHGERRDRIAELNNAADALILPSQYQEGFVHVSMEAASCGTPVIASARGCLLEIVTPTVGVLVNPPTAVCFADMIEKTLLSDCLDTMRKGVLDEARRRFSQNNVEQIIAAYRLVHERKSNVQEKAA
jgi:glycosyltransferase involved in cell wall biosynthesis